MFWEFVPKGFGFTRLSKGFSSFSISLVTVGSFMSSRRASRGLLEGFFWYILWACRVS